MDNILPIVVVLILGLAALLHFLLQNHKWKAQWRDLAKVHKLDVKPGSWGTPGNAEGIYRGRSLSFKTYSHGKTQYNASAYALSARKSWYSQIILSLENQPGRAITLWKKGLTDRAINQLGDQIGDEQFDKQFFAHESHKDFLNSMLDSSELRNQILKAHWPRGSNLTINENYLRFEMKDRQVETAGLISLFDLLCDVAEAVEKVY